MIRSSCALLAIIGLFLQGSQGGHMLLVEHTRCAEHGELVHVGAAHEHHAESPAPIASHGVERGPDHESAHAHCSHASDRRDAVSEVPASHRVAQPSVALTTSTPTLPSLDEGTPLYRTAPKTSPPA